MTISIWRYSHLTLAVSSFIFILLASITGLILALEPISEKQLSFSIDNIENISLNKTIEILNHQYNEVFTLEVDHNQAVLISAMDKDGNTINGYINPINGKYLGDKQNQSEFFSFFTNLHRSLFLKSTGRFIVGISSLLLLLIAISGTLLIIKRQLSLSNFFGKIYKENFAQYYHVLLSRIFLIPIIIISLTGIYLSLLRFDIITEDPINHQIDFENLTDTPKKKITAFNGLQNIQLADVKVVEFPFSDFIEDYYIVKLIDKELIINQFNGDIISEISNSNVNYWNSLSIDLHTGRGNVVWAIVLLGACISILFFIYSGFTISIKRRANLIKNKYKKDECEYIILVGSETGNTYKYASLLFKTLLKNNIKVYLSELNKFSSYKNAKQLIILTSTYGDGDAPSNSTKFEELLNKDIQKPIKYNVVGFGSLTYPNFCQFATEIDNLLQNKGFNQNLELFKVNEQSFEAFNDWFHLWKRKENLSLELKYNPKDFSPKNTSTFKVISKTEVENNTDNTYLLKLKTNQKFKSGDLLAIYPNNNHIERLYSIGKIDKNLQLSIKLHENGLGSNYLYNLSINQKLKAKIINNNKFHFPKNKKSVVFICNGTGIAPFLGMINENKKQVPITIYAGFRTKESVSIYNPIIEKNLKSNQLKSFHLALSKEGKKQYVTHLLNDDNNNIVNALKDGNTFMICGSLNMYKDVIETLKQLCLIANIKPIDFYLNNNQILSDCY